MLATQLVTDAGNEALQGQHASALAALAEVRAAIEATRTSLRDAALHGAPPLLVERLAGAGPDQPIPIPIPDDIPPGSSPPPSGRWSK